MSSKAAVLAKHDDDVVIVSAIRSALTKVRVCSPIFIRL
jgi:hypothetical protein